MANDSITTVLSAVAWGTKLSFGLYDFAVANAFAPAAGEVTKLAKEVNMFSQVLRQIGSRLKEDASIPSPEAFNVLRTILDQCRDVFREIENLVPLGQQSRSGSHDGSLSNSKPTSYDGGASPPNSFVMITSPMREELEWNLVVQARTQYLLAHLESLKLTMSVMLQTLYTAKAIVWARYDNNRIDYETVDIEKLQTESLIIDQQLTIFRAFRLYDAFKWQVTSSPLQIEHSPASQGIVKRDNEYGPKPWSLGAYQEPSLMEQRSSGNEIEDLSRVRQVSSPYVEMLLSRWTQMHIIQERLMMDQARPKERRRIEGYARRNWQAPAVDSDSEDEDHNPTPGAVKAPKLSLNTNEPVLMHVDEPAFVSSPISSIPRSSSLQPPGGPFSPQPSNSWGPASGSYFPQTSAGNSSNISRRRADISPAPSPLGSPRVSFSSDVPVPRVQTAFKVDGSAPGPPSASSPRISQSPSTTAKLFVPKPPKQKDERIPYRLRINQWVWDYADETLLGSNVTMTPQQAIKTVSKDTQAITEIFQQYVSREAIRAEKMNYTRVIRDRIIDNETLQEQCYCIEGALRPEEVRRLVERSRKIRGQDKHGEERKSSRSQPPPLDRSVTAPVYGNKFRDTHPREIAAANAYHARDTERSNTSNSNTSDSDSYFSASNSHNRYNRDRSKSRHRHDSSRGSYDHDVHRSSSKGRDRDSSKHRHRDSSRGGDKYGKDEKEKRKSSSGSAKMQTATKIAAGAGLATLLDGLPEMLSYL